MFKYAFFDLDGTLTQSEFGIINSIIYALNKMGIVVEDRESIKKFIGPPLVLAFKDFYGMSEEKAVKAASYYRECYDAGEMYNCPLYDGIEETLNRLSQEGVKLYVVTSKPVYFSERIVEHSGILKYFEKVVGPELSDIDYSKSLLIKRALSICLKDGEDKSCCVMVGDRRYDMEGAADNGIRSIGVLYGYGSRKELEDSGASFTADDTKDLLRIILDI